MKEATEMHYIDSYAELNIKSLKKKNTLLKNVCYMYLFFKNALLCFLPFQLS